MCVKVNIAGIFSDLNAAIEGISVNRHRVLSGLRLWRYFDKKTYRKSSIRVQDFLNRLAFDLIYQASFQSSSGNMMLE